MNHRDIFYYLEVSSFTVLKKPNSDEWLLFMITPEETHAYPTIVYHTASQLLNFIDTNLLYQNLIIDDNYFSNPSQYPPKVAIIYRNDKVTNFLVQNGYYDGK